MKPLALVVDLDGTLCNVDHRIKYVKCKPKQREKFHSLILEDKPNEWCAKLIEAMDLPVIFLTCRKEKYRPDTEKWLKKFGFKYEKLLMRENDNHTDDALVKKSIYLSHIEPYYRVLFVLEDRWKNIKQFRELGLTVLDCAGDDF